MVELTRFDELRLRTSLAGRVSRHRRVGIYCHCRTRVVVDYSSISFYSAFVGCFVDVAYCFAGSAIRTLLGVATAAK